MAEENVDFMGGEKKAPLEPKKAAKPRTTKKAEKPVQRSEPHPSDSEDFSLDPIGPTEEDYANSPVVDDGLEPDYSITLEPVNQSRPNYPVRQPVRAAKGGKVRIPVGTGDRINFEHKQPGFKYRMVNDEHDRINRFIQGGWEIEQHPKLPGGNTNAGADSQQGQAVRRSVGGGMDAVLMKIPIKLYEEDQKVKQDNIDRGEAALRRRPTRSGDSDAEGRYGGVEIKATRPV